MLLRTAEALPVLREGVLAAWSRGLLSTPDGVKIGRLHDGRRLQCDLADRSQRRMYLDRFEPGETAVVRTHVAGGDVVIDIGANIGWFTTLAAALVGSAGRVYAFEAFPATFDRLRANLAINGAQHVIAHNVALADEAGVLAVGPIGASDSGSVSAVVRHDRQEQATVPAVRLDDVVKESRIRLIKLDVEGFEVQVLRGAPKTLRRTQHLLVELSPGALSHAGNTPEDVLQLAADAGLTELHEIAEPGLRRFKSRTIRNVLLSRPA